MGSGAMLPRWKQDVRTSTDRRGIDAQGQFSGYQQNFAIFRRRKRVSNNAATDMEAPGILSGTSYTPYDIKGGYRHKQSFTTVDGETLWQLHPGSNAERSWKQLKKMIDTFIAGTPVDEYQFTPRIVVEAFEMGRDGNKSQPIVLISCSSNAYGMKVARALQQSGALESHSATFRVVVRP